MGGLRLQRKFVKAGREFEAARMGSISIKRAATSSSISAIQSARWSSKTTLSGEEVFTLKYPQESKAYAKSRSNTAPPI